MTSWMLASPESSMARRTAPTAVFPDRCGALVRQFYLDGQWGAPLHRTAFHDLGGNGLPYRF